jgi:hypothetical protein
VEGEGVEVSVSPSPSPVSLSFTWTKVWIAESSARDVERLCKP